jgi:hypothetical protein
MAAQREKGLVGWLYYISARIYKGKKIKCVQ